MISQVYALIMPEGYDPSAEPFTSASSAEPIALTRQVGGYWTGDFNITVPGAYKVAYEAVDNVGNVSELAHTTWAMATLDIELELNGYIFHPGDTLQVSVGYTNGTHTAVAVDLFLVAQFPDGRYLFISGLFGPSWDVSSPYWSGFLPAGHEDPFPIFWLPIPQVGGLEGTYYWTAAFVEPGTTWNIIAATEPKAMQIVP
nr:hypothetical protein [Bacillota bacterium]